MQTTPARDSNHREQLKCGQRTLATRLSWLVITLATSLSPTLQVTAAPVDQILPVAPVVTERGPDHKVWTRTRQEVMAGGRVVERKSYYTELATGMHYWRDGQWVDAQPVFEVFPDGIVARQCHHQVVLAPNLNTAGAVDLQFDDQRFRSHVFGLAYTDASSGNNVLFAQVKDCAAELIAPNQVLYRDAFDGDVKADVLYTLTREGLSQWVLLRENPPPPEDYKLASRSARIEVWTEWVEAPVPVKRPQVLRAEPDTLLRATMADPDLRDEGLAFGSMVMGPGAAFPLENDAPEQGYEPEVPVGKLWIRAADPKGGPERTFLIEQAEYQSIQPGLQRLPQAAALQRGNKNAQMAAAATPPPVGRERVAEGRARDAGARGEPAVRSNRQSIARIFPPAPAGATNAPHALLARSLSQLSSTNTQLALNSTPPAPHQPQFSSNLGNAFVLDYTIMNGGGFTNYVFAGDSTTLISGTVNLYGTTVVEGSAVVKYKNPLGINTQLVIKKALDCRTSAYRPAFFVSMDDNTVGETISGSTGNPNRPAVLNTNLYGYYLVFSDSTNVIDLHDVRLRNASYAIQGSAGQLTVRNAQIGQCYAAFVNGSPAVRNVLVHDGAYTIAGSKKITLEQATIHRMGYFRSAGYTNASVTNALLISVTNWLRFQAGSDVITNLDDTGIFQAVGSGAHYLSANSPYRNVGTTNLDATLLASLKQRTTYPPILLSNAITFDIALNPQAQRDTDLPDLGYEYDPVDWLAGGLVVSNAQLFLAGGAVLAAYGNVGILLETNSLFQSQGSAEMPNILTRYNMAQEDNTTNWSGTTTNYKYSTRKQ